MGTIPLQRSALTLVLLLLTAVAFGQTVAAESTLTSKMRQADARLNLPVTLSADRMYLGELLERLSLQTHIPLSMDENDRLSGTPITCDLKQLPLAEVMDSLVSLLGARNAVWEWKADAGQEAPLIRYMLRPTQAARNLADQTDKRMRDTLETLVNGIIRMAFLSPEERAVQVEDYIASVAKENPAYAQTYIVTNMRRATYWKGVRLFADVLSPDQRRRVLKGEEIDISLASMSEEDRQLALTLEGADSRNFQDGALLPIPPIEGIGFQTRAENSFKVGSLETYLTFLGPGRGGGQAYFGILKSELLPRTFQDWILPGDLRTCDPDNRLLTPLTIFRHEEIWSTAPVPVLDYDLAQVAATENVSFLGVLPEISGFDDRQLPTAVDKTAAQYFTDFGKAPLNLMHKWRGGVLLISYADAFYGDKGQYAYGIAKRLRNSLRQRGGRLSLEDVTEAGLTLSPLQLAHLTSEFYAMRASVGLKPLCTFYRRYPDACNAMGTAVEPKMRAFLQSSRIWPAALKTIAPGMTIRIQEILIGRPGEKYYRYCLQYTTPKQPWTDMYVIDLPCVPPKPAPDEIGLR